MRVLQIFIGLTVTLPGTAIPELAYSQSFNCSKARSAVERLICKSDELKNYDVRLSELYKETQAEYSAIAIDRVGSISPNKIFMFRFLNAREKIFEVRESQLKWLKERNQCRQVDCIRSAYINRLSELEKILKSQRDSQVAAGKSLGLFQAIPIKQLGLLSSQKLPKFLVGKSVSDFELGPSMAYKSLRDSKMGRYKTRFGDIEEVQVDLYDNRRGGDFTSIILGHDSRYVEVMTQTGLLEHRRLFEYNDRLFFMISDAYVTQEKRFIVFDVTALFNKTVSGELTVDIYAQFGALPKDSGREKAWIVDGRQVPAVCLEYEWPSSDNIEYYQEVLPSFNVDFPGLHWGKDFTDRKVAALYPEDGYSLIADFNECHSLSRQPSIDDIDYRESYSRNEIAVFGTWGPEMCRRFAPHWGKHCKSIALLGITTDRAYLTSSITGIYGSFVIDGRTLIAPLRFGSLEKLADELD